MRSGSSAQGGNSWPPAQRPYQDEATSGPAQSGPRSDPQHDDGRRREVPFGPEISWPNGFRQLDQGNRDVFESAYGPEPVYQQPAIDDYGYGDPGYADPSYDGPGTPAGPPAFGATGFRQPAAPMPGYRLPENRDYARPGYPAPDYETPAYQASNSQASSYEAPGYEASGYEASGYKASGYAVPGHEASGYAAPGYATSGYQPQAFASSAAGEADIYPVTGAQEALPDTGPQSAVRSWSAQDPGARPAPGGPAYPEQWYDHPRLEDGVREDQAPGRSPVGDPRPADPRPAESRRADPRLQGIRYDELRYDEPSADAPQIEESLDDESWFADLRRNAGALPGQPPQAPQPAPQAPQPAPPAPWTEPQRPSYQPAPASERFGGYGPGLTGLSGSPDRGGSGPQLSAGNLHQPRSRAGGSQPAPGRGPATSAPSAPSTPFAFLGAPTVAAPTLDAPKAQVGVLTSPAESRVGDLQDSGPQLTRPFQATPATGRPSAPAVRPGHGLDGPEITSSWPAQPAVGEADSFAEFWGEDNDNVEYSGLFGERDTVPEGSRTGVKRTIGRRRGRSNDHRLWLGLGGVVIIAAAAITGIIKFEFPAHGGPTHSMATPPKIGTYARTVDLERQTNVAQLRDEVIKMSAGQASRVVSAVYESGNSAAGNTEQIVMFIGGHLANAAPATSVTSFTQKFTGAHVVSAGALGGKAACVEEGGTSNSVSMCAWFDNDSFGEIVSPTMNASALAQEMLTLRPAVETVVKK